jgi:hypothetical protein
VRIDKTTGKHHMIGEMGSMQAEKKEGNKKVWELFKAKRLV